MGSGNTKNWSNENKLQSKKELKRKEIGSFDGSVDLDSGCCIVRWFDNKPVQLASNYVFIDAVDSDQRWSKSERMMISVPRPHIVKKYNVSMGGIDLFDMFQSLYRMDHKSKRWYIRIFYWILASSAINAWLSYENNYVILSKKGKFHDNSDKNLTLIQFPMELSSALVKNAKPAPKKRVGWPVLNDTSSSLDTSFSPKRLRKRPIYERLYLILDMANMNTGLFIGKIDQDAFRIKKKRGWAVQNRKNVFVWQKTWIVVQIFVTHLNVEIAIFYQKLILMVCRGFILTFDNLMYICLLFERDFLEEF